MDPMTDADVDAVRDHLTDAQTAIEAATELLPPVIVAPPVIVKPPVILDTPDAFDRALATALPGDVLTLSTRLVYPAPLTLRMPITLKSETFDAQPGERMTLDAPAPRFLNGLTIPADDVRCLGPEVRHTNPLTTIVTIAGARCILARTRILGDASQGAKRGIDFSGSAGMILTTYIDEIKQPAQDTQAIYTGAMGPGGLIIDNCHLSAAGQAFMAGGGPSGSADRAPRRIRLTRSLLTKQASWLELVSGSFLIPPGAPGYVQPKHRWQVKCALELKHAIDVVVDDCDLEYAGVSQGQGAYLIVLTPRNQNGKEPWTTIEQVAITHCRGRHASGLATFLGDDDVNPSQRMNRVTLSNLFAEDLNPKVYGGSGRVFFLNRVPHALTLDGITASGTNLKSILYCDEKLPPTALVCRNFKMPTGLPYAYHNPLGDTLASLQKFAPDAVLEITASDAGASATPVVV